MTNKEKAVGMSLQVRDLCVEKGVTRDNAETASLLVQQASLQMAEWKDKQFEKIIDVVIEQFNQYPDNAVFSKSNMIDMLIEIKKVVG